MTLDDDMAWDDDGRTVEEEDSGLEPDLLDDDFNGFLDDDDRYDFIGSYGRGIIMNLA